jgi:hypothetical protein
VNAAKIEWRAQQIADPIEKLRYLRQATAAVPPSRRRWTWLAFFLLVVVAVPLHTVSDANVRRPADLSLTLPPRLQSGTDIPNVWLVEKTSQFEVYSNGLRIENQSSVSNEPRWYSLLSRDPGEPPGPGRAQPAGIVFHTTESDQAPFQPDQNRALKRIGEDLLRFIRNRRAYHFLIDRFGRVHRIVVESDAANHAGHSVWADSRWKYIDLNASFLGVAFEAQTVPGQPPVNQAQIHAARVLTGMLRSKYNLAPENCVTHAQVSVNPSNMRIGWHTDWGRGFPFEDIGLPDNYQQPSPALAVFGFAYDAAYLESTGAAMWKGLALAEEQLRRAAAVQGVSLAGHRKLLQKRYRDQVAALRHHGAEEEN